MGADGVRAAHMLLELDSVEPGYCLGYVWQQYKALGAWTDRDAPTAYIGWQNSDGKHEDDRDPPAGAPVWFGPKASSSAGDVVISLGGGQVACTDWPYSGVTGIATLDERQEQIGRPYLGWTSDILGYPVDCTVGVVAGFAGVKEWDEMASKDEIKQALQEVLGGLGSAIVSYASSGFRNGIALVGPGFWHGFTGEEFDNVYSWAAANGRSIFADLPVITPINDRHWDILHDVMTRNSAVVPPAVDIPALAAALAQLDHTASADELQTRLQDLVTANTLPPVETPSDMSVDDVAAFSQRNALSQGDPPPQGGLVPQVDVLPPGLVPQVAMAPQNAMPQSAAGSDTASGSD